MQCNNDFLGSNRNVKFFTFNLPRKLACPGRTDICARGCYQAISEEMLKEASSQVTAMKEKAEKDIAQEKRKAVNEIKGEIGGMAVEIAGKVIEREISEEDHAKLIDEFIENVGEAS